MSTGRSNQLTKQVGEYLVASELARRGFMVATFSGNVPDFDIIATDFKGDSCPVQVKAARRGSWQFSINKFVDITLDGKRQIVGKKKPLAVPHLVSVFVIVEEQYGDDRFYVLEWSTLQDLLITHHKRMLDSYGGIRPRKPDSFHCAIGENELEAHKDNWSLISKRL
jgi:hypothetical protein